MASRKHSTGDKWKPLRDALPRVVNAGLLFCVLFNFIALYIGVSHTVPKTIHTVDSVTTNHFFVVTQVVERVSRSVDRHAGVTPVVERIGAEVSADYHYMEVNGRPMIHYCGRSYGVGDSISYGRIEAIFPDRVRLSDGLFMKNSKYQNGGLSNVGI